MAKDDDGQDLSAEDQVRRQSNRDREWNVSPAGAQATNAPATPAQPPRPASAPPPPPPPYMASSSATSKNWLGIVSLVLGVLGGGVLGIIFGVMGMRAAANGEANNRGLALAGTIVNSVFLGFFLIFMVLALALSGTSSSTSTSTSSGSSSGTDNLINELTEATAAPSPAPTSGGTSAGDPQVSYIETDWLVNGDCYLELGPNDLTFKVVDCTEPHWGEVFAVPTVGYDVWPGADAMSAEADEVCLAAQDAALEEAAAAAGYEFWFYWPTEQTFAEGDREAWCVVAAPEGETKAEALGNAAQ